MSRAIPGPVDLGCIRSLESIPTSRLLALFEPPALVSSVMDSMKETPKQWGFPLSSPD